MSKAGSSMTGPAGGWGTGILVPLNGGSRKTFVLSPAKMVCAWARKTVALKMAKRRFMSLSQGCGGKVGVEVDPAPVCQDIFAVDPIHLVCVLAVEDERSHPVADLK